MLDDHKKAQLGETMTWVVATITVIFILILSLFLSVKMGEAKEITKVFSEDYESSSDLIMEKTIFVYFLLDESKKDIVYGFLQEQEDAEAFYVDFENKFGEIESILK